MTTAKPITQTVSTVKLVFWRVTASLMGLAVRRKPDLQRIFKYSPLALLGGIAFLLGRWIGILLQVRIIF